MTTLIILAIIGWVVSLTFGVSTIINGWVHKDKETFGLGISTTLIGLMFGFVVGWVLLGAMVKTKYIDPHFDDNDDEPERVKG